MDFETLQQAVQKLTRTKVWVVTNPKGENPEYWLACTDADQDMSAIGWVEVAHLSLDSIKLLRYTPFRVLPVWTKPALVPDTEDTQIEQQLQKLAEQVANIHAKVDSLVMVGAVKTPNSSVEFDPLKRFYHHMEAEDNWEEGPLEEETEEELIKNERVAHFCVSCATGDIEKVKEHISEGMDIHALDELPLRVAVSNHQVNVVLLLLKAGADIHVWNDLPFRDAVKNGNVQLVKLLLAEGACFRANDDEALRSAIEHNHIEIAKLLMSLGGTPHYLVLPPWLLDGVQP